MPRPGKSTQTSNSAVLAADILVFVYELCIDHLDDCARRDGFCPDDAIGAVTLAAPLLNKTLYAVFASNKQRASALVFYFWIRSSMQASGRSSGALSRTFFYGAGIPAALRGTNPRMDDIMTRCVQRKTAYGHLMKKNVTERLFSTVSNLHMLYVQPHCVNLDAERLVELACSIEGETCPLSERIPAIVRVMLAVHQSLRQNLIRTHQTRRCANNACNCEFVPVPCPGPRVNDDHGGCASMRASYTALFHETSQELWTRRKHLILTPRDERVKRRLTYPADMQYLSAHDEHAVSAQLNFCSLSCWQQSVRVLREYASLDLGSAEEHPREQGKVGIARLVKATQSASDRNALAARRMRKLSKPSNMVLKYASEALVLQSLCNDSRLLSLDYLTLVAVLDHSKRDLSVARKFIARLPAAAEGWRLKLGNRHYLGRCAQDVEAAGRMQRHEYSMVEHDLYTMSRLTELVLALSGSISKHMYH
jgi:hypothetical protein